MHHLGDIVAAGAGESDTDGGSSDSGMGDFSGYGAHAHGRGGGGRGGGGWNGSEDDSGGWGVEYTWSAQGGVGRHQAPTLVHRMPQAICTNYLRVRERVNIVNHIVDVGMAWMSSMRTADREKSRGQDA